MGIFRLTTWRFHDFNSKTWLKQGSARESALEFNKMRSHCSVYFKFNQGCSKESASDESWAEVFLRNVIHSNAEKSFSLFHENLLFILSSLDSIKSAVEAQGFCNEWTSSTALKIQMFCKLWQHVNKARKLHQQIEARANAFMVNERIASPTRLFHPVSAFDIQKIAKFFSRINYCWIVLNSFQRGERTTGNTFTGFPQYSRLPLSFRDNPS